VDVQQINVTLNARTRQGLEEIKAKRDDAAVQECLANWEVVQGLKPVPVMATAINLLKPALMQLKTMYAGQEKCPLALEKKAWGRHVSSLLMVTRPTTAAEKHKDATTFL
jgi:hypothetical protein